MRRLRDGGFIRAEQSGWRNLAKLNGLIVHYDRVRRPNMTDSLETSQEVLTITTSLTRKSGEFGSDTK